MTQPAKKVSFRYEVEPWDSQREGTAIVSGWAVRAQITFPVTGRTIASLAAVCMDEETALLIAYLLGKEYSPTDDHP